MREEEEGREESRQEVRTLLSRGLTQLDLPATESQLDQLETLVSLLHRWAERINLTGHRDPIAIAGRLVLDSAAMANALPELASESTLTDLGSGAGFPGLPIAILCPQLEVRLVEARQKRHHFQREACRRLDLSSVVPLLGRSDRIDSLPSDVVVAQAMSQPEEAIRLMAPWARPGGLIVLPASESATEPPGDARVGPFERREYRVPETGVLRRLWVAHVL